MDGPFNERVVFQLQDLSDIRQVPDHQVGFSDSFFFFGGGGRGGGVSGVSVVIRLLTFLFYFLKGSVCGSYTR